MDPVQSTMKKLLARAFLPAPMAFAIGLCLVRSLIQHDGLSFAGMSVGIALVTFALFCTHRAVHGLASAKLATNESARLGARQYLFSCAIYSLNAAGFGVMVSGSIWGSLQNPIGIFMVVFWGAIVCSGIYPVHRDTKRCVSALLS
jgi:hypothetical protein